MTALYGGRLLMMSAVYPKAEWNNGSRDRPDHQRSRGPDVGGEFSHVESVIVQLGGKRAFYGPACTTSCLPNGLYTTRKGLFGLILYL